MKLSSDLSPRQGSALVITLCILVLITSIVIAFFAQSLLSRQISFSSAGQERARLVALSALDQVQAAMNAEMQAGSSVYPSPTPTPGPNATPIIMRPNSAATMVPYHMLSTSTDTANAALCPNLVAYSNYNQSLWPASAGSTPAYNTTPSSTPLPPTNVKTSTASSNGRYVDATRWAKPALNTTVSHVLNYPAGFTPYWVLMSRSGVVAPATAISTLDNNASTNQQYVIGRFGYVVYDEGGLIDIAAGGYPSSVTASSTTATANKGGQGYADLTQLGLTSAQSDKLVQWRNLASASSASNYLNYLGSFAPQYGFMRAATGDNAFVSRQDFLRFWQKNVATTSNPSTDPSNDYLRYFTTFSREKNAPSWGPFNDAHDLAANQTLQTGLTAPTNNSDGFINVATNLGASYPYEYAYSTNDIAHLKGTATTTGSPPNLTPNFNRLFPGVRVTKAFTRLNGESAVIGEPLVKNRFDLSKLVWIYHNSSLASGKLPSGVALTDVYNYFGLTPGSDGWSWTYNHGNSTTDATHIMTLDEVATSGREPDFFELLQAGILQGSLGTLVGDSKSATNGTDPRTGAGDDNGGDFYRFAHPTAIDPVLIRTDLTPGNLVTAMESYQIMQIGANIIDQANTNGFPRDIALNGEHFYGIENLPYVQGLTDVALRPSPLATISPNGLTSTNQAYLHRWIGCALWNPHQNAATPAGGPAKIRIVGHSGAMYPYMFSEASPPQTYHGPGYQTTPNWETSRPWLSLNLADYKTFNGCNGAFSEPTMIDYNLSSTTDNGGVSEATQNADQKLYGRVSSQCPSASASQPAPTAWTRAGLYVGYSFSPENPDKISLCAPLYTPYTTLIPQVDIPPPPAPMYASDMNLSEPPSIFLQYLDPNTTPPTWRTYQEVRGLYYTGTNGGEPYMEPSDPEWNSTWWSTHKGVSTLGPLAANQDLTNVASLDPRSQRMNMRTRIMNSGYTNWTAFQDNTNYRMNSLQLRSNHYVNSNPASSQYWAEFSSNVYADSKTTYTDNDFVMRPGDSGGWTSADPQVAVAATASATARPVMLNRPFRDVGELGFVSRDSPWKTLDFTSTQSPDAALLDIFCVGPTTATNTPPPDIIAGKLNLNSASLNTLTANGIVTYPVLQALVAGTARTYSGAPIAVGTTVATADAPTIASAVGTYAKTTPLRSVADLPLAFPTPPVTGISPATSAFPGNKVQREAMVRALADGGGTRTWNLLIDVIAQSGRLKPNAATTGDFTVEGEKRYWLHVAIDRFTGEIVDKQLEPVSEQ